MTGYQQLPPPPPPQQQQQRHHHYYYDEMGRGLVYGLVVSVVEVMFGWSQGKEEELAEEEKLQPPQCPRRRQSS